MLARLTRDRARTAFLVLTKAREVMGGPDTVQLIARNDTLTILAGSAMARLEVDIDTPGQAHAPLTETNSAIYQCDDDWMTTDDWPEPQQSPDLMPDTQPPDTWTDIDPLPPYDTLHQFAGIRQLRHIFHADKVWAANRHRACLWPHDTPIEGVLATPLCRIAHYAQKKVDDTVSVGRTEEVDYMRVGPFTFRHQAYRTHAVEAAVEIADITPRFRVTLSAWPSCDTDAMFAELGIHGTLSGLHTEGAWARLQTVYLDEMADHLAPPIEVSMSHPRTRPIIFRGQVLEVALMPAQFPPDEE